MSDTTGSSLDTTRAHSLRPRTRTRTLYEELLEASFAAAIDEDENVNDSDFEAKLGDKEDDSEEDDSDTDSHIDVLAAAAIEIEAGSSSVEEEKKKEQSHRAKKHKRGDSHEDDSAEKEWSTTADPISIPIDTFVATRYHNPMRNESPFELLSLFLSLDLIKRIVGWMIEYSQMIAKTDFTITVNELYAYIAAHIYMGIDYLANTEMYWSGELRHSFIASLFTYQRYKDITACFIVTQPTDTNTVDTPELHTRFLFDLLNTEFPRHYHATQHLTIDGMHVSFFIFSACLCIQPRKCTNSHQDTGIFLLDICAPVAL